MEREGRGRLTIQRRVGERLFIGEGADAVIVEVLPSTGARAKLRVDAPLSVTVRREELAPREARS
jgi:sRNA-binding carbon storage regulator CsrA